MRLEVGTNHGHCRQRRLQPDTGGAQLAHPDELGKQPWWRLRQGTRRYVLHPVISSASHRPRREGRPVLLLEYRHHMMKSRLFLVVILVGIAWSQSRISQG